MQLCYIKNMEKILKKAEQTHTLSREEIKYLLKEPAQATLKAADEVRKKYVGDEVHLRGLIEFSNICKQNCLYCGIRKDNATVKRYRLTEDEIVEIAKSGATQGLKTIVLQSGEDAHFSTDKMCKIISQIKSLNLALTLSLGEKTYEEYKAYKEAGADRYLIRIETTDEDLYKTMHPNMNQENRKECILNLKKLGYETGTGSLIGLPNQSIDSLADDILFFKEINADMIGIGPFIPSSNTPLKNEKGGTLELALKVMAITRLLLPDINIPATTAMEALHPNGQIIALQSGANVIMPNITESQYKEQYALYPGKSTASSSFSKAKDDINEKLAQIGRTISSSKGFRIKTSEK